MNITIEIDDERRDKSIQFKLTDTVKQIKTIVQPLLKVPGDQIVLLQTYTKLQDNMTVEQINDVSYIEMNHIQYPNRIHATTINGYIKRLEQYQLFYLEKERGERKEMDYILADVQRVYYTIEHLKEKEQEFYKLQNQLEQQCNDKTAQLHDQKSEFEDDIVILLDEIARMSKIIESQSDELNKLRSQDITPNDAESKQLEAQLSKVTKENDLLRETVVQLQKQIDSTPRPSHTTEQYYKLEMEVYKLQGQVEQRDRQLMGDRNSQYSIYVEQKATCELLTTKLYLLESEGITLNSQINHMLTIMDECLKEKLKLREQNNKQYEKIQRLEEEIGALKLPINKETPGLQELMKMIKYQKDQIMELQQTLRQYRLKLCQQLGIVNSPQQIQSVSYGYSYKQQSTTSQSDHYVQLRQTAYEYHK